MSIEKPGDNITDPFEESKEITPELAAAARNLKERNDRAEAKLKATEGKTPEKKGRSAKKESLKKRITKNLKESNIKKALKDGAIRGAVLGGVMVGGLKIADQAMKSSEQDISATDKTATKKGAETQPTSQPESGFPETPLEPGDADKPRLPSFFHYPKETPMEMAAGLSENQPKASSETPLEIASGLSETTTASEVQPEIPEAARETKETGTGVTLEAGAAEKLLDDMLAKFFTTKKTEKGLVVYIGGGFFQLDQSDMDVLEETITPFAQQLAELKEAEGSGLAESDRREHLRTDIFYALRIKIREVGTRVPKEGLPTEMIALEANVRDMLLKIREDSLSGYSNGKSMESLVLTEEGRRAKQVYDELKVEVGAIGDKKDVIRILNEYTEKIAEVLFFSTIEKDGEKIHEAKTKLVTQDDAIAITYYAGEILKIFKEFERSWEVDISQIEARLSNIVITRDQKTEHREQKMHGDIKQKLRPEGMIPKAIIPGSDLDSDNSSTLKTGFTPHPFTPNTGTPSSPRPKKR